VVERVHELFVKANEELKRYTAGTLPLYVEHKGRLRHVTMTTIEEDMMAACSDGKNTIEYGVHTHLYPGFRGDNVSLLTGKYYLVNSSNTWTEVTGAPSSMLFASVWRVWRSRSFERAIPACFA
jgi:hypothetical protein